jgi:hypothetical protein
VGHCFRVEINSIYGAISLRLPLGSGFSSRDFAESIWKKTKKIKREKENHGKLNEVGIGAPGV